MSTTWLADFVSSVKGLGAEKQRYETPVFESFGGDTYVRQGGDMKLPAPDMIDFSSLDGLLAYHWEILKQPVATSNLFRVEPQKVSLFSTHVNSKPTRPVFIYARAQPMVADLSFVRAPLTQEEALIVLKTCFQPDEQVAELITILGTIKVEGSITTADDGISQEVTAKTGVGLVKKVPVGLFTLKPYETFPEIQTTIPGRHYVVRINQNIDRDDKAKSISIAFHAVKDAAVDNAICQAIKNYLVAGLTSGGVTPNEAIQMVMI